MIIIKLEEKKIKKLEKEKKKTKKVSDDPFGDIIKDEKKSKNKVKIEKTIEISEDLMKNIFDKIIILSKGKNPNEQSADDSTSTSANSVNEKEVDENSKKYLTMSSITKFCRTLVILLNKFKSQNNITEKSIIDFSFELLFE